MKRTLVTLAIVGIAAGAFAQGQVVFKNLFSATPAPLIYLPDSTTKVPVNAGATAQAYAVDLYYGAAGVVNPNSLTSLGIMTYFSTTSAGYFSRTQVATIPGIPGDSTATLQIRAWETKGIYNTYAAALAGATGAVGEGNLVQVVLKEAPNTPLNMVGIQPMILHPVPEPTVAAIAGLGLASMLILRRKK